MSELIDRANAEMQPEVNTKSLIRTLPTKTMNELLDRIAELEQSKKAGEAFSKAAFETCKDLHSRIAELEKDAATAVWNHPEWGQTTLPPSTWKKIADKP